MVNAMNELIDALRYCADGNNDCGDACPFYDKQPSCSMYNMMNDAADALEAADKRISDLETALAACRARNERSKDDEQIH